MPATGGGAAWKRKPSGGSWSSPHKCSTIGMPAARSAVRTGPARPVGCVEVGPAWAGTAALLPGQPAGGGSGEERVPGAVALAAPVAVPAGVHQHGPARNVVGGQRVAVDRAPPGTGPHHHAVQVGG